MVFCLSSHQGIAFLDPLFMLLKPGVMAVCVADEADTHSRRKRGHFSDGRRHIRYGIYCTVDRRTKKQERQKALRG